MTSPIDHIRKKNRDETLSLGKRILFLVLVCCIQLIYIPTSIRTTGGIEPKLSIDVFPVWPIWVVPYLLCYPLWLFSNIWAMLKMEDRQFRGLVAIQPTTNRSNIQRMQYHIRRVHQECSAGL